MAKYGPFGDYKQTVDKNFDHYRVWWRSTPRGSQRLPYTVLKRSIQGKFSETGPIDRNPTVSYMGYPTSNDVENQLLNACYNKFKEKCQEQANLALNLAERKQAVNMMANRALQLVRFTRALRKLKFRDAATELGLHRDAYPKGVRANSKAFGSNYLEFHFGWSPLVADIGKAVDILLDTPLDRRVRAGARASEYHIRAGNPPWWSTDYRVREHRVQMIADVRVTNPNALLASQLGFVNPAMIAWELVPFSFVVDWFANVGDVLSSYTDFTGLELIQPMTTAYASATATMQAYGGNPCDGWYYVMNRSEGIRGPTLSFRPFKGFSVRRGLAAISLLLQHLR